MTQFLSLFFQMCEMHAAVFVRVNIRFNCPAFLHGIHSRRVYSFCFLKFGISHYCYIIFSLSNVRLFLDNRLFWYTNKGVKFIPFL